MGKRLKLLIGICAGSLLLIGCVNKEEEVAGTFKDSNEAKKQVLNIDSEKIDKNIKKEKEEIIKKQEIEKKKQLENEKKKQEEKEETSKDKAEKPKVEKPNIQKPVAQKPAAEKPSNKNSWVSTLDVAKQTDQIVTVKTSGINAVVELHQKGKDGIWKEDFKVNGKIGYGGLKSPTSRKEGDGSTPSGTYSFGTSFGIKNNPGSNFTYKKVTNNSYWVGDYDSKLFNQFVEVNGKPEFDVKSSEHLMDYPGLYNYVLSINFNTFNPVKNRGSAIFLHCSKGIPTAGCVAIPEDKMIYLLKTLRPSARIYIK